MPPAPRQVPMFAAEPPQEPLPYGRWAEALGQRFAEAADEDVDVAQIVWFPDRTWNGRTYVPATSPAGVGEVFGYVSYTREHAGAEAMYFSAVAHFTEETATQNPDWSLDLSDEEIGQWRGPEGQPGIVTLVWGVSMVANGEAATAELGPTTTDQCTLVDERFTLISLDAYADDYVEVRLYGARGAELARESLYEDDEQ